MGKDWKDLREIPGNVFKKFDEFVANMIKNFGDLAVKLSRNPLGLIALSVVLVYAIAVLWAGLTKSDHHSECECVIVWFIAIYPFVVFLGLCFLVAYHHTNLYSPSDFPNPDSFDQLAGLKRGAQPTKSDPSAPSTLMAVAPAGWKPQGMEAMILNTLWTHQVNLSPEFDQQWCFKVYENNPMYRPFIEAATRLIGRGLVAWSHEGMIRLTSEGWRYCKTNHSEFGQDDFFPDDPIQPDKKDRATKVI